MDVLVICGAGGVGKSTVAFEIGSQLQVGNVPHAMIDIDELDRVYPQPEPLSALIALSGGNLAALWESFSALGHSRLILTGVMLDLDDNLSWINGWIGSAEYTVVRLHASDEMLRQRVEAREIGSGREEQMKQTLTQAKALRDQNSGRTFAVQTDGRSPIEIAKEILDVTEWAPCARLEDPRPR